MSTDDRGVHYVRYTENLLKNMETSLLSTVTNTARGSLASLSLVDVDTGNTPSVYTVIKSDSRFANKSLSKFVTNNNITLHDVYYAGKTYFNGVIFDNFFKTTAKQQFNAYYDFLQLDETSDADSNSRHYLTTSPFRLMRGVLNQHVIDILQNEKFSSLKLNKLLMFNTKFSQSGELLKDKELMPETL